MFYHNIPPVYDSKSKLLILGSFPSVRSRESCFFYAHPQNRFWRVISELYGEPLPVSVADKKALLLKHGVALWDVIASCEIRGSSDSSIREHTPNDIRPILKQTQIDRIFCNGQTAFSLYNRYILPLTGKSSVYLPSTSPANASWHLEELILEWKRQIAPESGHTNDQNDTLRR